MTAAADLGERARALVPVLRERAASTEELRMLREVLDPGRLYLR